MSQGGITSGRTAITLGFERRSNNKLTQFFVGQCRNPSSRSRAESLVVVTAEVRGGPRASSITAASVWRSGSHGVLFCRLRGLRRPWARNANVGRNSRSICSERRPVRFRSPDGAAPTRPPRHPRAHLVRLISAECDVTEGPGALLPRDRFPRRVTGNRNKRRSSRGGAVADGVLRPLAFFWSDSVSHPTPP